MLNWLRQNYDLPSGEDRKSAREISNEVFAQTQSIPSTHGASNLLWLWGQFVDHDIDLTLGPNPGEEEPFPILVPKGDPFFDPYNTGTMTISLTRSGYHPDTGDYGIPREQVNGITAFIDASNVYGSDKGRNAFVRGDHGKLKTSDGNLLPYNDGTQGNAGGPSTDLFLAGDVRANENVALTAMHTLWMREHNWWVDKLKKKHPYLSAEKLYQQARAIVEAEIQVITYNEFLPFLLGKKALKKYKGYRRHADPQIANNFATASYRLGHTMLSSIIHRINSDGSEHAYGHLALAQAFFRPDQMQVNEAMMS